ncbi:GGDEF domain-containing protein [Thermomonas sp.]|uniref:GGDEF domain-containing protein n=1 Tax=Thermomonas sp. TaxID=1971895 RepID=UPI00248A0395|nr:GGDEF domain-containing protein [Thermomonas sp.]MDI1253731.1 GGDEF domain-containing protein [Thermomonas sp.]
MASIGEGIRFNTSVVKGFVTFSQVVGWALVLVSLAILATWISGVGPLLGLVQAHAGTHAGAAFAFMLAGCALLLGQRAPRASVALSLLLMVLGGTGLLEFAIGQDVVIWGWLDALLPDWLGRPIGRMTDIAAVSFTLLGGVGAAVVIGRAVWLREACALAVIVIAMATSASYGLVLAGDSTILLRQLPIMTAAQFLLLSLAWMASVPTTGLTRIAVADSLGGAFARRLILPALLLPLLLTFLFKAVESQLGMSESMALALASVATGGVVTVMIMWVAFLLDRSERQRRTVHVLREDARTDALTGLANRRKFDTTLAHALQDKGEGALVLLMLDIDHFKKFNDSFGHQAGDEVLRETGRLLSEVVRTQDLAARYGGEEFVIVLPHSDVLTAEHVGQRILAAFHSHEWLHRAVTVSIGAAVAEPDDGPEDLVRRADEALYHSKQEGRDRLTFAMEQAG